MIDARDVNITRPLRISIAFCFLLVVPLLSILSCTSHRSRVVIGSKNFTEQLILGELFAQIIEARTHIPVERRFYLAGTFICHQAILAGRIDVYPEYTGTALTAVLKQPVSRDRHEVYDQVKQAYEKQFGLALGSPLGFDNTFAIVIRGEDAWRLDLKKISQVAPIAPRWRAGFGYEFMERPDGYAGLAASYGLHFAEPPRIMDLGLLTRALKNSQVDLIAGNNTDGLIPALDLVALQDDHHYFPPYEAMAVMRQEFASKHPDAAAALDALGGMISDDDMRHMNYAVDGEHRDPVLVVRDFLKEKNLVP